MNPCLTDMTMNIKVSIGCCRSTGCRLIGRMASASMWRQRRTVFPLPWTTGVLSLTRSFAFFIPGAGWMASARDGSWASLVLRCLLFLRSCWVSFFSLVRGRQRQRAIRWCGPVVIIVILPFLRPCSRCSGLLAEGIMLLQSWSQVRMLWNLFRLILLLPGPVLIIRGCGMRRCDLLPILVWRGSVGMFIG